MSSDREWPIKLWFSWSVITSLQSFYWNTFVLKKAECGIVQNVMMSVKTPHALLPSRPPKKDVEGGKHTKCLFGKWS